MSQEIWTACNACGKRVTSNSIHTCSPQLKELTAEEIEEVRVEKIKVDDVKDDIPVVDEKKEEIYDKLL